RVGRPGVGRHLGRVHVIGPGGRRLEDGHRLLGARSDYDSAPGLRLDAGRRRQRTRAVLHLHDAAPFERQPIADLLHAGNALDDAQGLFALRLVGDHTADLGRAVVNGDVNAITPKLPALTQVVGDGVGEFLIGGRLLTGRQRRTGLHAQPRRLLP